MRMPFSVSFAARIALALLLVAGAVTLISAASNPTYPTVHDKAFYADPNLVNFVRPGLAYKIQSAEIAADGTIKARVKVTDPRGLPLDREGITTPGNVSMSFVAAVINKGQTQYHSYTTRTATSPITQQSAVQASADSGGTWQKVGDGEYVYTFRTKAPAGFDANATHSIAVYGSRNLNEFDMGTQYASDVFHFVPDGSPVTTVRDVIKTASCNKCHDQLSFHGGSRRGMETCVMCHTPQTTDPDTGNTVDMVAMTHKIHMGANLPSVRAGGKYSIIGHNQHEADYSTVVFPADARRCESCHEQGPNAAPQAANYLTRPSRQACGACHDDVNFATGENHVNLPQLSDNSCATCHQPQGEYERDASIKGAHVIPAESASRPNLELGILRVDNGSAGNSPTVTFTVKDPQGNGIPMSTFTSSPNRLALVLAGPTLDYGYIKLGNAANGYVSEDPSRTAQCSNDGVCTYTFNAKIPADATGTYSVGIEARRGFTIMPGTRKETAAQFGAVNKVFHFSVDGSPVMPRRAVVDTQKCNNCHGFLSLHGANRNQVEQCVLCHNPSETDVARRAVAVKQSERELPPQSVEMALMIHKIHWGERMHAEDRGYTVIGFGGTDHDFTHVRYPAQAPNGSVGDLRNCNMCHVNGSEQLPLQAGVQPVTDPQGLINPAGKATAACTACHGTRAAASHALLNTSEQLGESCDVCHGGNSQFSVNRVHAR